MSNLLSIGQVIDRSLEHYLRHFKELLAVSLWLLVAYTPWIVGEIIGIYGSGTATPTTTTDWLAFILQSIGVVSVLIAGIWTFISLVLVAEEQAKRGSAHVAQAGKTAWKLFFPYVFVSILVVLFLIALAFIAVPGIALFIVSGTTNSTLSSVVAPVLFFIGTPVSAYLLLKFGIETSFAPYMLMLQNQRGAAAIKESIRLVRGRWFATFLRFVIPKMIYFLIIFVVSFIMFQALAWLTIVLASLSPLFALAIFALALILGILISVFSTPLIVVTDYYLFDSLRQSK